MKTIGITALVPPELVFACGCKPLDINNLVPHSKMNPKNKLCAWTATWRDMILRGELNIDSLVVVAGGDCHNALVDGQRVAKKIPAFYFFYPFNGDREYLQRQLEELTQFLGGTLNLKLTEEIETIKHRLLELDSLRAQGRIPAETAFQYLISASDMQGDINRFKDKLLKTIRTPVDNCEGHRVALVGVPPIYHDFHRQAQKLGLQIVFDELPFEFIRHSGRNLNQLARSYADYTFARSIEYRFNFLEKELKRRRVDGVLHYTQFACHHVLEDEMLREHLNYPVLTIQGDLPGNTPEQLKLRLEAFSEMLWRKP
jgi:benzoyl-CoA reductase/2-hydroxyglutaryl-CoA dehydratase subunit BcrC/BadD/HgdB